MKPISQMTEQERKDLEKAEKSKSENLMISGYDADCAYIQGYLNCLKELREEEDKYKNMTPKQRSYVEFIEEWSGVPYNAGDNLSKYINENKLQAHHNWDLECEMRSLEHEDAGDRD